MKLIGLLSDTHGFIDPKIKKYFKDCDEIWHAGDIGTEAVADELAAFKKLRAVYGNIDGGKLRVMFPQDLRFECEGIDVFMTHIGGYPGRYDPRVREIIRNDPPHIFICGHSHILKVMRDKKNPKVLHINPGAAGNHGFHKYKTIIRFVIDAGKIRDMEAIELGKRGALQTQK